MGFWKVITKIFRKEKLKARNFVEIYKSENLADIEEVKRKLEKYKIPVYFVNKLMDINDNKMFYILRIPEDYFVQAKEILNA